MTVAGRRIPFDAHFFTLVCLLSSLFAAAAQSLPIAWVQRYNGQAGRSDIPYALARDAAGNAYITGSSMGETGFDFFTIKYSADGDAFWTNRFDGQAHLTDIGAAIAVDASSNVYVTGRSYDMGLGQSYYGCATLKYSPEGVALWTNRYDIAANNFPVALIVDHSGNPIMTAQSYATPGGSVYLTIKYSSSGVPLWTNVLSSRTNVYAAPISLMVDGSDDVFITGSTSSISPYSNTCTTVAYSSSGMLLWTNSCAGTPVAGVADLSGNLFLIGNFFDSAIVGYSSSGVSRWTGTFPAQPTALALDGDDNLVVTGFSSYYLGRRPSTQPVVTNFTAKYSSHGFPIWTTQYTVPQAIQNKSLCLDSAGDVVVFASTSVDTNQTDCGIVCYSPNGTTLWTNLFNIGIDSVNYPLQNSIDPTGSLIASGSEVDSTGIVNSQTIAISNSGAISWSTNYSGPGTQDDKLVAMCVDNSGNVFVTGYSTRPSGYTTIASQASGHYCHNINWLHESLGSF